MPSVAASASTAAAPLLILASVAEMSEEKGGGCAGTTELAGHSFGAPEVTRGAAVGPATAAGVPEEKMVQSSADAPPTTASFLGLGGAAPNADSTSSAPEDDKV